MDDRSLAVRRARTIATASRWNSSGYFDGRPLGRFLLDMDFLLYEVSAQRGDGHRLFSSWAVVGWGGRENALLVRET